MGMNWNEYQNEYKKKYYKKFSFYLHLVNDKELIDYLKSRDNIKQTIVDALNEYRKNKSKAS